MLGSSTIFNHYQENALTRGPQKRKFDDGDESHLGEGPRKRARFINEGHMRPSSATACPVSLPTEEHVSQWDWSSLDCDYPTELLGHADFSAFQPNATGEISRFQDVSPPNDGGSTLPQLPDHAWSATGDNGISLDNTSNLVASDPPSGAPLDLWATSCSLGSQRLTLGNDACPDENSICMEDILQRDCDFLFNLQDNYNHSSLDGSLHGERDTR
jgi:hypothetical protein